MLINKQQNQLQPSLGGWTGRLCISELSSPAAEGSRGDPPHYPAAPTPGSVPAARPCSPRRYEVAERAARPCPAGGGSPFPAGAEPLRVAAGAGFAFAGRPAALPGAAPTAATSPTHTRTPPPPPPRVSRSTYLLGHGVDESDVEILLRPDP